jgi:ABC-type sugar transport system substrate-binding protein
MRRLSLSWLPRLCGAFGVMLVFVTTAALAADAPKVGVLLKGRSPFWSSMEKGALDAGSRLGVEVVVKAPPSEGDVAIQIQLLSAMAAQNFAAIVIVPANKDSLAAPVAALAKKA